MTTPQTTERGRVRIYATGACDGFEKLRDSLAQHPEIELVGAGAHVAAMTPGELAAWIAEKVR